MAKLMLLTGVYGGDGVSGDPGQVLEVSSDLMEVWADGVRAEAWKGSKAQKAYREALGWPGELSDDG